MWQAPGDATGPDLELMTQDAELVAFLQWALPRLRMRWRGFRRVRGQVGKRLRRRLVELGLGDLRAYPLASRPRSMGRKVDQWEGCRPMEAADRR
jgi:hypothetical protein